MTTAARPYTRQQLIETRQLIPASDGITDDFGFTLPVAYSLTVWCDAIFWPDNYAAPRERTEQEWQREWYLLLSLYDAIQQHREDRRQPPARLDFEHYRLPGGHGFITPHPVRVAAEKSPGDHGEQVITIMQPDQRVPWI
ncbi:hypothetical protein OG756_41560 (plasmid) [Streptomyces sp. NBC_01310]|uniref:DUF6573 family protein n=1 Tax=Streptomyces TaxID=1883 RepID=UPI00225580F1|nr:DUF6573 family protein [Streptomyces virginiae]MCX5278038.1 hypothetical protein [Streptomyces virginiae]WSJ64507.1 hypothetical protein OG756_41560 [Streptomyces sp. NBC_01310]